MTAIETDNQVRIFGTPYGPYVRLPHIRLDELKRILDDNQITYFIEENRFSSNGGPFLSYVHLPSTQSPELIGTLVEHMNLKG